MPRIFISYRREDSPGYAGRLYDRLRDEFGRESVFIDVDALQPGDDFVDAIGQTLAGADCMLVVIGRRWVSVVDEQNRRRLEEENDYVRLEITTALERQVRTIPVLVERATMPRSGDLPEPLRPLTRRHAIELSDARWDHDIKTLIGAIDAQRVPRDQPTTSTMPPVTVPAVDKARRQESAHDGSSHPPARQPPARSRWPLWMAIAIVLLIATLAAVKWTLNPAPQTSTTSPPRSNDSLPAARAIIDRHVNAIGGRAAILSHSSSHAKGTVTIPARNVTGTFESFGAKPGKWLEHVSLGAELGDVREGFDGTTGWSLGSLTGPSLFEGKRLEEKRFHADFFRDLHEDRRYASMTTLEKTTFDGRSCYKVRLVRKDGTEELEFYEVESGLQAGSTGIREMSFGPQMVTDVYADYRQFGNLLRPATVKSAMMGLEEVKRITVIEYDRVDPSVFQLPGEVKALLK